MKNVVRQTVDGYRKLFDIRGYPGKDVFLKVLISPLACILFTVLLLATAACFIIERLMAPFFKLFVLVMLIIMRRRFHGGVWRKRIYGFLMTILSLVFAPFVVLYLFSILLKSLCKMWMKSIIKQLDFAHRFARSDILLFDDKPGTEDSEFRGVFKDVRKTTAVGGVIEAYLNKMSEPMSHDEIDFDHDEDTE